MNCGAKVFLADFDDSNAPVWDNLATGPPYLHPSGPASVRFLGFTVMVTLVWGCLSMLPVPLIAAGFCERAGRVKGARSARAAAPQAPLTRLPGSGSCRAAGGREFLVVRAVV